MMQSDMESTDSLLIATSLNCAIMKLLLVDIIFFAEYIPFVSTHMLT